MNEEEDYDDDKSIILSEFLNKWFGVFLRRFEMCRGGYQGKATFPGFSMTMNYQHLLIVPPNAGVPIKFCHRGKVLVKQNSV